MNRLLRHRQTKGAAKRIGHSTLTAPHLDSTAGTLREPRVLPGHRPTFSEVRRPNYFAPKPRVIGSRVNASASRIVNSAINFAASLKRTVQLPIVPVTAGENK